MSGKATSLFPPIPQIRSGATVPAGAANPNPRRSCRLEPVRECSPRQKEPTLVWYTIEHACGDTERHQIPGTNTGGHRDRRAERMRHTECSACTAKAQQAERTTRDAAAAASAAEQKLPD